MKERETCDSCGQTLPREQLKNFDGSLICPECLDRETVLCSHCGTRIWKDENASAEDEPLCQHCYDRYYVICVRCGHILYKDDAYYEPGDSGSPYCESCYGPDITPTFTTITTNPSLSSMAQAPVTSV